jgi:NAD(P)-dependent dehydrogenase (short-subunit alcohol dehydrogenase family)
LTQTALITGAGSGIGASTARRLHGQGWQIIAVDANDDGLTALASELGGARLACHTCDVRHEQQVNQLFAEVAGHFGSLNALVLSAGVLRTGRLDAMDTELFDQVFDVNVRGLWLCARGGVPALRAAAASGASAAIVNLASIAGIRHKINSGAYAASKAAVIALTKVLAVELAADGIRVNAVAPATVDTPMVAPHVAAGSNSGYKTSGTSPMGRIAAPEDIANAIVMLLGVDAAYITGTVVPVDGGTSAAFVPA